MEERASRLYVMRYEDLVGADAGPGQERHAVGFPERLGVRRPGRLAMAVEACLDRAVAGTAGELQRQLTRGAEDGTVCRLSLGMGLNPDDRKTNLPKPRIVLRVCFCKQKSLTKT